MMGGKPFVFLAVALLAAITVVVGYRAPTLTLQRQHQRLSLLSRSHEMMALRSNDGASPFNKQAFSSSRLFSKLQRPQQQSIVAPVRGGAAPARSPQSCDYKAIGIYVGATALQLAAIGGFLWCMEWAFATLSLAPIVKLWVVRLFFAFTSLKSRVFSVLDNSRPSVAREEQRKREKRRPGWMPPPKAFPVIWISIGFLRTIASSLIYEATGTLLCPAILALYLHLSIGDTWNTIASVEDRTGAAVPGVLLVWCSVVNAVRQYFQTLPLAGKVLAPSAVWISVAVVLVTNIWWINGKEPLYPVKRNA